MKKIVMLVGLIFALGACNTAPEETHSHEEIAQTEFVCPMECEGDKTYAQAGECPVCKMELQEVAQVVEE